MKKNKSFAGWNIVCLMLLFLALPMHVSAGSIQSVSLLDSEDGDVLIVESDAPLEYQVFDLSEPPRLVMTFPGSEIDPSIVAIKGDGQGVVNLFPKVNELGVRLEMSLSEALSYDVDEQGNTLIIRFDAPDMDDTMQSKHALLERLNVSDRSGVTEIVIDGRNMDSSHNAFLTNKNRTLVVDLWGGKSALKKDRFQYATQHVKSLAVGEADDRLRLIIDLLPTGNMAQQIDASADQMVIRLGAVSGAQSDSVKVESVDFQPDGALAKVLIRTNTTNPIIDVSEEKGNTVINIANAKLEQGKEISQDLRAFAGPLAQIDSYRVGDDVKVVVRVREEVEVNSFQQGNVFSLSFIPASLAIAARGESGADGGFSYTGEKVTFDFKDIDIRNALKLIAEMSDLNIIMSDDVTGTLTMRLVDVPWDQALEIILSARGLGKEQNGNVLRVAPIEVLRTEYESKIEARKGSLQLEPLLTEFITLSYSKVSEIKKMLETSKDSKNKSSGDGDGMPTADSSGLMSSRGSVLTDQRTNTLIIKDTREAINNVKRLVAVIDKPIQQVLIEARIVEASDRFTHSIGVRWGGSVNRETATNFPGSVAIGASGTTSANSDAIISGGQSAATGRGFLVDLPASGNGGSIGLSLGSFSNAINLDLELSAAQADGDAKIVSNPRIVTSNLKLATVTQGVQIAFVTPSTANNPATVKLVEAALTLQVTPQITADGGVILDVKVTKNAPTGVGVATGIDTKEVTTNVYVKDGETIVIGGVYTRDKVNEKTSVPYLSEIPFLGWLFKTETVRDNKSELLIFITPKILNGSTSS
ncbi:MAG TPA: type IV pilus secretin family protein [Mariprofundaceae bacterium]|nr:type IV pilus secretin family protein [Mariprofundaceae bacterium]